MCHGMYCSGSSLNSFKRKKIICVFPESPTRTISWPDGLETNVKSWYNYYTRNDGKCAHDLIEQRNFISQSRRLQLIIKKYCMLYGNKNVFVGGYSQGGTIAADAAMRLGISIGGLILCRSCFLNNMSPICTKFPILVMAGKYDQIYPLKFQKRCMKQLKNKFIVDDTLDHFKFSRKEIYYVLSWIMSNSEGSL